MICESMKFLVRTALGSSKIPEGVVTLKREKYRSVCGKVLSGHQFKNGLKY